MRAGPQLGVDAFSISNYGSAMFAQVQPQHSPLMLLTPMASAVPSYIHNEIKISMNVQVTSVAISSI
jgi:hypothetical protein